MANLDVNKGHIYLLEFLEDNNKIYKIGYTEQEPVSKRLNCYKNYNIKFTFKTRNCSYIEKKIIDYFKKKFILYKGNEWFNGDIYEMLNILPILIKKYTLPINLVLLNKIIENENKKEEDKNYLCNIALEKNNLSLIGFINGVYDLRNDTFMNSPNLNNLPKGFNIFNTRLKYKKYTHTSLEILELKKIIEQILPIEPVREYFLYILSSCLSGKLYLEKFCVLTGCDFSGKNTFLHFIQDVFGNYFTQINDSILCSNRDEGTNGDRELANLCGKRLVVVKIPQTSSKTYPFHWGKLKAWTGGDILQCRDLYKGINIKFKLQAKWFLICNDIPDIPCDDHGTWRRISVINFPSKFIPECEFTGRDYEFKRINNMNEKLRELKEPFMWLLLEYYKKLQDFLKKNGLIEPPEIIELKNKAWQNSYFK